jgi:hypothetical protein
MDDLYLVIRNAVQAAWNASWTRTDVPVLWRENEPLPLIDPISGSSNGNAFGLPYFFRNEIDFGREEIVGFGGGRFRNFRIQYGSVILRNFSSVTVGNEDEALRLISAATNIFRSYRVQQDDWDLSFIGSGSGFDWGPTENGVWFLRGCLEVFEFRFPG